MFSPSYRLLTFLPVRHSVEEDRDFIANSIMPECEVLVAVRDGTIGGFVALDGDEVRMLYVAPAWIGLGVGRQLIEAAQTRRGALELWSFRANERASRFYRANGFRAVRVADGAGGRAQRPDILFRWDRTAPAA